MLINATDTQIAAFHSARVQRCIASQEDEALRLLAERGGDWVIAEFAAEFGWEKSSVSRTFKGLIDKKLVTVCGKRASRITGIDSRPIKVKPAQKDLFQ